MKVCVGLIRSGFKGGLKGALAPPVIFFGGLVGVKPLGINLFYDVISSNALLMENHMLKLNVIYISYIVICNLYYDLICTEPCSIARAIVAIIIIVFVRYNK
jgi:hypothetical protein